MAFEFPASMDELVYFTRRVIGDGKAVCWVPRELCPKCKEGFMSKPINPKTGRAKIRATEYECPKCANTIPKAEYEATLTAFVQYTCPECKKEGESKAPFKRKSIKGVQTLRVNCEHCNANIDITKKMKVPKVKKK